MDKIPDITDFLNPTMLALAALVGGVIQAINKYCEFSGAKKNGVDNYLAVATLALCLILLFEYTFSLFGLISISSFTIRDAIALLLVVMAEMLKVAVSIIKVYKK